MAEQDPLQSARHNQFGTRTRHVLEGVPQIGFELQKLKPADGLSRCPETTPFASCLRACLEFLGDGYGHREIEAEGKSWRLDNAYTHLMGVTGLAFRLVWNPGGIRIIPTSSACRMILWNPSGEDSMPSATAMRFCIARAVVTTKRGSGSVSSRAYSTSSVP